MATTQTASTDLRVVKDPTTPKTNAIVEEVLNDPEASNPDISDRVEDRLGERPDPSWVSRVRSSHLSEDVDREYDTSKLDDVVARLDRVEDVAQDAARAEDVDRAIAAVEDLTEAVDALREDVRDIHASIDLIEDMVARDITDDVVGYVLKKELDRVDGPEV